MIAASIQVSLSNLDTTQMIEVDRAMPDADTSGWVSRAAVADVVAFLASAESNAITGATIPVFGRG